jgi:neurotransmitter:Na+ symporter, NSS family
LNKDATESRGNWNSKLGFIFAAAGSAVGLGNIWAFPAKVADNGGAIFLLVYFVCCLIIGFPVMVGELTLGRHTKKNPVGAFKALSNHWFAPLIGFWGLICGVMILSFYLVVAGWTAGYVMEEFMFFMGQPEWAAWFGDLSNGPKNAIFSVLFMLATILIITGGVSNGIEKATKLMMPALLIILLAMIGYVITLPGAMEGVKTYLNPDFSKLTGSVIFSALGQSFFSLSLGMGALITYGSYISRKQNMVESAMYVTLTDFSVAFLAGFLVIPAMFVAQNSGITIFNEQGNLVAGGQLVFQVLPAMFHSMESAAGVTAGVMFFVLLGLAALTSTISLLEVPVSYVVDEHGISRKKAAWGVGLVILIFSLVISFNIGLIDFLSTSFNDVGLPLGGFMISIFLGYVWTTQKALIELGDGYPGLENSWFKPVWVVFIKYICPILIGAVLLTTIYGLLS